MPLTTPSFALPYPGPLDAPCDFAQQWCAFSDAFQGVLDTFTAITDRTVPAIPIAQLALTAPVTIEDGQPIPFDTVAVDTAGWIDFDADRTKITVDRAGIYVVNAHIETISLTGNVYYTQLGIRDGSTNIEVEDVQEHPNAGNMLGFQGCCLISVTNATTIQLSMSTTFLTSNNVTLQRGALSVFWHADRTAP